MSNPIVHFDISGPLEPNLSAFYSTLFNWKIENRGPGYSQVETPSSGLRGSIQESETSGVNLGVQVADLKKSVQLAEAHGGTVVMPPTDNGWVFKAQVTDPAGNVVTLIQADKPNE